jgi:hypothetical protein
MHKRNRDSPCTASQTGLGGDWLLVTMQEELVWVSTFARWRTDEENESICNIPDPALLHVPRELLAKGVSGL